MIVLVGFMGAGKTTIGQALAARLGVPFLDADREIEAQGQTIPEIFAAAGETGFRDIEAKTITRLLNSAGVLAVGGGACESASTRRKLEEHTVVFLEISREAALARVAGDAHRPVLADPNLAARFAKRQDQYRAVADVTINTEDRDPDAIIDLILTVLNGKEQL